MQFIIYDRNGSQTHVHSKLEYARRHVHKDNVLRVGLVNKGLLITFKDLGYMEADFSSQEERDLTLNRWRNLKGVKRVQE